MIVFAGGAFSWLLLGLLAVATLIYFGRLIDFRRSQIDYQDLLRGVENVLDSGGDSEALAICEETPVPAARIVATAIAHREGSARLLREAVDSQGRAEISRLDRRLAVLAIIGQVAPLIGLLGTVVGFIRVVLEIDRGLVVSRAPLIDGAMYALVPTALGLAVAIVVAIFYGSLRVRLERMVVDLEAAASQIVGYISTAKEKAK